MAKRDADMLLLLRPARHIAGGVGYWSWLRVVLVLVVVAQPKLRSLLTDLDG